MLDVAQTRVSSPNVTFRQADALELPFEDGGFDLVVCQFGLMFYPDKVKGNAEARRVLRDDGAYLFAVWDRIELNLAFPPREREHAESIPGQSASVHGAWTLQLCRAGLDRA